MKKISVDHRMTSNTFAFLQHARGGLTGTAGESQGNTGGGHSTA